MQPDAGLGWAVSAGRGGAGWPAAVGREKEPAGELSGKVRTPEDDWTWTTTLVSENCAGWCDHGSLDRVLATFHVDTHTHTATARLTAVPTLRRTTMRHTTLCLGNLLESHSLSFFTAEPSHTLTAIVLLTFRGEHRDVTRASQGWT